MEQRDYQEAWMKHPDDAQLCYLYASRTLLKENPEEADSMLRKLTMDFPRNSLYLRAYAGRCYTKGDKETACWMTNGCMAGSGVIVFFMCVWCGKHWRKSLAVKLRLRIMHNMAM